MITDEQREDRRRSIGASDTPAILGLSGYAGPYTIWLDKLGERQHVDLGRDVDWGNDLELAICARARKDLGVPVEGSPATRRIVTSAGVPLHANLDGWMPQAPADVIAELGDEAGPGVLECKSGERQDWHTLQVAHQMFVAGAKWGLIAHTAYGSAPDYSLVLLRDWTEVFCRDVVPNLRAFWTCVETRTPPRPTWADSVNIPAEQVEATSAVQLPAAATGWVRDALAYAKEAKVAQRRADELKNRLRIAMGPNTVGELVGTKKRVSWKPNTRGSRVLRLPRSL